MGDAPKNDRIEAQAKIVEQYAPTFERLAAGDPGSSKAPIPERDFEDFERQAARWMRLWGAFDTTGPATIERITEDQYRALRTSLASALRGVYEQGRALGRDSGSAQTPMPGPFDPEALAERFGYEHRDCNPNGPNVVGALAQLLVDVTCGEFERGFAAAEECAHHAKISEGGTEHVAAAESAESGRGTGSETKEPVPNAAPARERSNPMKGQTEHMDRPLDGNGERLPDGVTAGETAPFLRLLALYEDEHDQHPRPDWIVAEVERLRSSADQAVEGGGPFAQAYAHHVTTLTAQARELEAERDALRLVVASTRASLDDTLAEILRRNEAALPNKRSADAEEQAFRDGWSAVFAGFNGESKGPCTAEEAWAARCAGPDDHASGLDEPYDPLDIRGSQRRDAYAKSGHMFAGGARDQELRASEAPPGGFGWLCTKCGCKWNGKPPTSCPKCHVDEPAPGEAPAVLTTDEAKIVYRLARDGGMAIDRFAEEAPKTLARLRRERDPARAGSDNQGGANMRAAGEKPDPVGPLGMAGTRSDDDKGDPLSKRAPVAGLGREPEAVNAVATASDPKASAEPSLALARARLAIRRAFDTTTTAGMYEALAEAIRYIDAADPWHRDAERAKHPLGRCCIAGRCDGEHCPCACHPGNPDRDASTDSVSKTVSETDALAHLKSGG